MYHDTESIAAEATSPHVDRMRQYVDISRALEQMNEETSRIAKERKELQAKQHELRSHLMGYLEPDTTALAADAIAKAMSR